jgi:hypothetical protein
MVNCLLWSVTYLKITEASHILGLLYSVVTFVHKFWQKNGWATFGGIFSQTRLVTLPRYLKDGLEKHVPL